MVDAQMPKKPIKNPTVWVSMGNYTTNTPGSGPMRVREGQEITSPNVVKAFQAAGADIRPLR